jgi:tetratricopeptide (TPR) repeat protein/TolB-like protein
LAAKDEHLSAAEATEREAGVPPGALSSLLQEIAFSPAVGGWAGWLSAGLVVGRFELLREIGRGGFGVVWEARDRELDRSVAFKAVRAGEELRLREERLLREAEVAARLCHPNIVALLDVGRCEQGPYLVLELLRGETLAERLARGPLPFAEALRVAGEVAKGLAHAHAEGVVHRDLKPGNVFLCTSGCVKVLDFGMAHVFGQRKVPGGTPEYMAPEQWRGAPEDERTDVFSLGVLLYQVLADALPFPDDRGVAAQSAAAATALCLPSAPHLCELVRQMLEKDPVNRPRDGGEVLAALAALAPEGAAPSPEASALLERRSRPPSSVEAPTAPARRRRVSRAAVAGALVSSAIALAVACPPVRETLRSKILAPSLPAVKELAVLPFASIPESQAEQALAAGLGEVLTNRLGQVEQLQPSLRVVSAQDVQKQEVLSAKEARAAFGATLALSATFRWGEDRDRVEVEINLLDTRTRAVLRTAEVEGSRREAPELERRLVGRIAKMLQLEPPHQGTAGGAAFGRSIRLEPPHQGTAGGAAFGRSIRLEQPGAGRRPPPEPHPAPGAYALYLQGRGYLQRHDRLENLESALATFDEAVARDPNFALAWAGRAETFLRQYGLSRDPPFLTKARDAGLRALALDDDRASVQLTVGLVHVAAGEYASAVGRFQRALELEPGSDEAHRALASAYAAAGRQREAEATFRRAIELRPTWAAFKDLGVYYVGQGRLPEALTLFQRVVELTPDNYSGYSNVGAVLTQLGRPEEAAKLLERSLALRPTGAAFSNLGTAYFYQERYREAAEVYRKATDLNRTDARLWGNLADAERWSGLAAEAGRDYRQAIALLEQETAANAHNSEARSRIAMHRSALGEREKALADIAESLRLGPRDGQVLFRAAYVYEELGLRERALEAIGAAFGAGFSPEAIRKIPPLQPLREDPRYRALLERLAVAESAPK